MKHIKSFLLLSTLLAVTWGIFSCTRPVRKITRDIEGNWDIEYLWLNEQGDNLIGKDIQSMSYEFIPQDAIRGEVLRKTVDSLGRESIELAQYAFKEEFVRETHSISKIFFSFEGEEPIEALVQFFEASEEPGMSQEEIWIRFALDQTTYDMHAFRPKNHR